MRQGLLIQTVDPSAAISHLRNEPLNVQVMSPLTALSMGLVLRTKSGFACQVISYRFKREGSAEGISGAMTACVPLRAQGSEDSI